MIALAMFQKNKGGRGKKADVPYARGSFTLPPDLKEYLDAKAEQHGVSMSEMLARILQDHQSFSLQPKAQQASKIPKGGRTTPPVQSASKARIAPKEPAQSNQTASKSEQLRVLTSTIERSVRGRLRWDKERYARAEELLAEGDVLTRQVGGADWINEKGHVISWRTVEALKNVKIISEQL